MEPRPQQPRQPSGQRNQSPGQTPGGDPSSSSSHQPLHGHDPQQSGFPEGYDPTTVVAPPRSDYDYSPLDLAPPGQRRRRQLIAGAIGALSIILLGALIVFGWTVLRDDTPDDDPQDRVAIATQAPENDSDAADGGANEAATPPPASEEPTTPSSEPTEPAATEASTSGSDSSVQTDEAGLTALLPDASALPEGFELQTESVLDEQDVVTALGGSRIAEQNLADWGWTTNVQREFANEFAEAGATSSLTVSLHGFKDAASATEALPYYSDILINLGYSETDAPALGENARMLKIDQEDGGVVIALYVQKGPVLYRFGGYALNGDPAQDVLDLATQVLGE